MENTDDCLNIGGSTLAREPDINFVVDNVEKVHGYVDEKAFERRDDFNEDLNQHEQQSCPSQHADTDFRYEISESLPKKSYPVPTEFDHDIVIEAKFFHDRERTQSQIKESSYYQGEMDELHGSYFLNPSSQSKTQAFHNETGTEDSAHSHESPLTENANLGAGEVSDSDMGRSTAASHAGKAKNIYIERSQHESIKSSIHEVERKASDKKAGQSLSSPKSRWWDNEPEKDDSPSENGKPGINHSDDIQSLRRTTGGSISPMTKARMSISPGGSPSLHHSPNNHERGYQDLWYAPRSHSHRISSSPEQRKGLSSDHFSPARQTPASTQGIQQWSQHKDSSLKHVSASLRSRRSPPRSQRSQPNFRRRDSLESRSPIWHRDSYDYQRGDHDRSRSRSPYSRAHHRSTRGRHSPRRRSPFPEYHSHRRSPRRKPWSPPPNRKTGLGKPGRNLFVAGFSFMTSERDLERKFSRYGRVRDVRIVRDKRSGDSRGFGFLSFERDEDADAAIRGLDETEWNGRIILVEKSKT